MKPFRGIPLLPVLCLLLVADIGWRVWTWTHPRAICATATSISGQPFMVLADHRSNVDAISIKQGAEWEAVWVQMDLNNDSKPDEVLHYFDGKDVFNVNLQPGQPPKFDVYFYGPGKSVTWWLDRGNGSSFTDRIFYDENGDFVRHEVLQGQTWRPVDTRKTVAGGNNPAFPLHLTNGVGTIETPPTTSTNR